MLNKSSNEAVYQGLSRHQEMGFTPETKVLQSIKAIQGQQPMVQMIGFDM